MLQDESPPRRRERRDHAVTDRPLSKDRLTTPVGHNRDDSPPIAVGTNIAITSILSLGGMLSGFIMQVLTAKYFGASAEMDAFLVAFLLLSFLQSQFQAGGIMSSAFIPPFAASLREGPRTARALFSSAAVVVAAVASILSLACVLCADYLIHYLGDGLAPNSFSVAVAIFRLLSILALPLSLAGLFSATLQAQGRFVAAAAAPMVVNCSIAISIVFLVQEQGIMSYVWGLSIGILSNMLLVSRPLAVDPTLDLPLVSWRNPHLRLFLTTASLLLFDAFSGLLLLAAERHFAALLAPGTLSHMNYAKSLYTLPLRLVVTPAQVVLFSLLSRHFALGKTHELQEASAKALALTMFILLPTAIVVMCLSTDIVSLTYQRGRFTSEDTAATATLLRFYAFSIPALAVWWQLRMISFAIKDAALPLVAGLLAFVTFMLGNSALIDALGPSSLALNWGVAYYAASIALSCGLAYRHGVATCPALLRSLLRLFPAALGALISVVLLQRLPLVPDRLGDPQWLAAVRVAIYGIFGFSSYLGIAWITGVEEFETVHAMCRDRIKRFYHLRIRRP